jgi:hypothetical protein
MLEIKIIVFFQVLDLAILGIDDIDPLQISLGLGVANINLVNIIGDLLAINHRN